MHSRRANSHEPRSGSDVVSKETGQIRDAHQTTAVCVFPLTNVDIVYVALR